MEGDFFAELGWSHCHTPSPWYCSILNTDDPAFLCVIVFSETKLIQVHNFLSSWPSACYSFIHSPYYWVAIYIAQDVAVLICITLWKSSPFGHNFNVIFIIVFSPNLLLTVKPWFFGLCYLMIFCFESNEYNTVIASSAISGIICIGDESPLYISMMLFYPSHLFISLHSSEWIDFKAR